MHTMRMLRSRLTVAHACSMARKWRGLPWKFDTRMLRKPCAASERPRSRSTACVVDGLEEDRARMRQRVGRRVDERQLQKRAACGGARAGSAACGATAPRPPARRRRTAGAAHAPRAASRSPAPRCSRGRAGRTCAWSASPSAGERVRSWLPPAQDPHARHVGTQHAVSLRSPLLVRADQLGGGEDVALHRLLELRFGRAAEIRQHDVQRVELAEVAVPADRRARSAVADAFQVVEPLLRPGGQRRGDPSGNASTSAGRL